MNMTESPCYLVSCISLAVNAPIQNPTVSTPVPPPTYIHPKAIHCHNTSGSVRLEPSKGYMKVFPTTFSESNYVDP